MATVSLTLRQVKTSTVDGYEVDNSIIANDNIPDAVFLFIKGATEAQDLFHSIVGVKEINEYPETRDPGFPYYRKNAAVVVKVTIAEAVILVQSVKDGLTDLVVDMQTYVDAFEGTEDTVFNGE